METEELLFALSYVSNRAVNQTKFLFELCDNDFDKHLKVEALQKRKFLFACPADKETVDAQVKEWERLREEDKKRKEQKL